MSAPDAQSQSFDGLALLHSPRQAEVMRLIWTHSPATVREIHERIATQAYTTILTICVRLAEKGPLDRRRIIQRMRARAPGRPTCTRRASAKKSSCASPSGSIWKVFLPTTRRSCATTRRCIRMSFPSTPAMRCRAAQFPTSYLKQKPFSTTMQSLLR